VENIKKEINKAITDHSTHLSHIIDWDETRILHKEANWKTKRIKESIWIKKMKDYMNRDEGSHKVSHIYNCLMTLTLM